MTEAITTYCKVCGHAKEHHDLDVHLDPKDHVKARKAKSAPDPPDGLNTTDSNTAGYRYPRL